VFDLNNEAKTQAVVLFPFGTLTDNGYFSDAVLSICKEGADSFFSLNTWKN